MTRIEEVSQSNAEHWRSVYRTRNLKTINSQYSLAAALHIVDELKLPEESHVLEIGCRTGLLTVALARRKYIVHVLDKVRASLDRVHQRSIEAGLKERIITGIGDAHALGFQDGSFDLVLAIGIIPWLHSPSTVFTEFMRVLKPGGFAVISADNRWSLNHILDPRLTPMLSHVREAAQAIRGMFKAEKHDFRAAFPRMYSIKEFDTLLASGGLHKSAGMTFAVGPFTLMGRRIFPDSIENVLHSFIHTLADRNVPILRSTGSQYIVLAQKPDPVPIKSFRRDEALVEEGYRNI